MDELRRNQRRKRLSDRLRAKPDPPPFEQAARIEVQEALAALPVELREPIVLIDMLGASYSEVAVILNSPVGTVKSRVHRGRLLLAEALSSTAEEASEE